MRRSPSRYHQPRPLRRRATYRHTTTVKKRLVHWRNLLPSINRKLMLSGGDGPQQLVSLPDDHCRLYGGRRISALCHSGYRDCPSLGTFAAIASLSDPQSPRHAVKVPMRIRVLAAGVASFGLPDSRTAITVCPSLTSPSPTRRIASTCVFFQWITGNHRRSS